jgi:hypothetical protein
MTTSDKYSANWYTSVTIQENLMHALNSSCAIMIKVMAVLVSVGGVCVWAVQPYWNSCAWPSLCCFLVQNLYLFVMYVDTALPGYWFVVLHGIINTTTFICIWIDINQAITMPVFVWIQPKKLVTLVKTAGYPNPQPDEWPKDTIPTSV